MVAEIIVLNPKPLRKKKGTRPMATRRRRKLSAKQIAAGFGGKRRRASSSRRRRSTSRTRRTRRNPIAVASATPVARRRRRRSVSTYVRAARRRTSRGKVTSMAMQLVPAGIGALGALGLDYAWPHLPIPEALQTGPFAPAVRLAGAVGIGMVAGMIAGRKIGREVGLGALTVTAYDIIKGYVDEAAGPAPTPGSGTGFYSAAQSAGGTDMRRMRHMMRRQMSRGGNGVGMYTDGLGAYIDG